jgi:uncharacterized membrane protein YcaP (DUF421 family)
MIPEEIKLGDWQRILIGDISPLFLIEVFFRTLLVYFILLAVVRWLGKRMSGQLTIIEMTVMITLGAIVSVPMQAGDRGVLQGILILFVALGLHRAVNYFSSLSARREEMLHGQPTILVRNGVMQLKEMEEVRISRQQLFSELRSKDIDNLGSLRRVYLEPSGSFSLILLQDKLAGLPVFPPADLAIFKERTQSAIMVVCANCGTLNHDHAAHCSCCMAEEFVNSLS